MEQAPIITGPISELRNVTKLYDKTAGIRNISLRVNKGDFFALLGPNGAGKSTIIRILTTLLIPSSGDALVNGINVIDGGLAIRRDIGVVFQTPSLDDDMTALENMLLHVDMYGIRRSVAKERIDELLKLVELKVKQNDLVKTFSGGMKRRLEIARALIHRPSILFLDEPTLGLDAQTRNLMWSYLRRLNSLESVSVFFSTHYMHEVEQFASRAAIIDNGSIVQVGEVEVIKRLTGESTFEAAYLALTGKDVRDQSDHERTTSL